MATKKSTEGAMVIAPIDMKEAHIAIVGTAPYVQNKFSSRVLGDIEKKQREEKRRTEPKKARNFEAEALEAAHVDNYKHYGIPAPAFRAGMISACRVVGFKMTQAKLSIFVRTNRFDISDQTPLIPIFGEITTHKCAVRIQQTIDVRWRPMWREGWTALVPIEYDGGMFNQQDILNLLQRVGAQVGIGEGRPDSKSSAGMGWGTFRIARPDEVKIISARYEEAVRKAMSMQEEI